MIERLELFERMLTDLIARFAPWLSPLPTAYLTARATIVHLHWPDALGVVAGAIIECLGLGAMNTALDLYNYNRSRRKSEPAAPLWIALTVAAIYFVAVTGLTVLLDTAPALSGYAPLLFPALSVSGITLIALRMDQRRRIEANAADRLERSERRIGYRSGRGQLTGQLTGQTDADVTGRIDGLARANAVRQQNRGEAIAALLAFLGDHPNASFREMGLAAGRSKAWAIGTTDELAAAGKLHRNGKGWEIHE